MTITLALACSDDPQTEEVAEDVGVTEDSGADSEQADVDPSDRGLPDVPNPELMTIEEAMAAVDPFIGSGGYGFGYASLTPAVQTPFGMVRLGPDTTARGFHAPQNHFSGYNFYDPEVRGFSHIHFVGTGAADYGNVRVLPVRDLGEAEPGTLYTIMDKDSEVAEPGYYRLDLPDEEVTVELTASPHAGVHRYSFRGSDDAMLLFDPAASVNDNGVIASSVTVTTSSIVGWVEYDGSYVGRGNPFTLHFDVTIEPSAEMVSTWDDSGYRPDKTDATGVMTGAVLSFEPSDVLSVMLRVGLSYVDADAARLNREVEVQESTFEEVQAATWALWEEKLSLVRIGPTDRTIARIFYTALYNVYRMPTRFDGVDGRYRGLDAEIHTQDGFTYLTDLSLWDTFRTLHPWLSMNDPAAQRDILRSLMAMKEEGGYFPIWPAALSYTNGMVGDSSDIVFADSALRGVDGIDYEEAFEGLYEQAMAPIPPGHQFGGRDGIDDYMTLGYLPYDSHAGSVSVTLEYAWADWALANLGDVVGADEADALRERSRNYQNLFHEPTGFFLPRARDGEFDSSIARAAFGNDVFVEGTAWHWRFYLLQDPADLSDLLGGPERLAEELETFFSSSALGLAAPVNTLLPDSYYWHGNEPTIHVPLLFWAADRYDRVAYWVREIQTRLYGDGPDGLPGNDDGGTMSSWYLFNAVGIYPVAGSDLYLLSAPIVPYAEVRIGDGVLRVVADGASLETRFVESVTLNGELTEGGYLHHADLIGATLVFEMSAEDPGR
jgi:predicted alpha-1,2-mannosidase